MKLINISILKETFQKDIIDKIIISNEFQHKFDYSIKTKRKL